ncbi:MAG: molybdopterin-dependent oxidoreductase [Chloroflexi bacterium]|nr:molybdopterin-dependent oxidoreductase [Chloroflexota bacterium]
MRWSGASAVGAVVFNGCRIPEEELQVESPVDLPEDLVTGIDNWYATICRQDQESCGIIVRVVEGRAKKVEGNPDYPINRGKHNARSEAGLQSLYHPDRITEPLFREGSSGEFTPISWAEAHGKIADSLRNLPDKNRFLLVTQPLRGHMALLASEFVKSYGGKHMAFETLEQVTLRRAIKDVFGQDRLPDFDIEHSKYLLSFGADFLSTWLSPVKYSRGYGELRQGAGKRGVHVQVDSRFSMTAANADEWVPVKPGGEGVLAMSMMHVIIREGLGDRVAANALTGGNGYMALDAFRPNNSEVRDATGVDASRIEGLAHAFADPANQPSLAIGGGSAGAHTSGLFNLRAIYSLNLLVNNVSQPGGIFFNPAPPLEELDSREVLDMGVPASFRDWKEMDRPQVLMVRGVNPVHGLPPDANFTTAVENADFVVSFSSFMDETAAMANLIMPEHTYLEDWGDDVPDPGPRYQTLGLQQPVVRPFYPGTGSFGDEMLALGKELGLNINDSLGLSGNDSPTFQDLLKKGAEKLWMENRGSVKAATFDGFWNGILQRGGWWDTESTDKTSPAAPSILSMAWPNIAFQGPTGDDTYNLIPFLSNSIADGNLAHLPWLQAAPDPVTSMVWHTWVEINTKTAEEKGIRVGDMMEITSPNGTVKAPAYVHPAVPPWTVSMPIGQGHTTFGRYAEGVGVNTLSILAPITDVDTNALAWAATRVRIRNTGEHIDIPRFEGNVPAFEAEEGRIIKIASPR